MRRTVRFLKFVPNYFKSNVSVKFLKISCFTFFSYSFLHNVRSFETEWTFGDEKADYDQELMNDPFLPAESFMSTLCEEANYKIFSGNANMELAQEVATHLDVSLGRIVHFPSPSGEIDISVLDNVRNQHVFIIQSLSPPINDNLTELFLLISCLKRASAKRVTCVIPYLSYMRHTETGYAKRKSLAIADIAKMLENLGCDDIITMNLHISESKGFFSIPILNLDVTNIGASYLSKKKLENPCVISLEGKKHYVQRAADLKSYLEDKGLNPSFTCLIKDELKSDETKKVYSHIGDDMEGKDCILVDNIIEGGVTLNCSTEYVRKHGANRIFMFVPHGILTPQCLELIDRIHVDEVITTNSIKEHGVYSDKVRYLSVGKMLAEAICHVKENKSLEEVRNDKKIIEQKLLEVQRNKLNK